MLAEHLRRVEAPAELWSKIHRPQKPAPASKGAWRLGLIAVVLLVVAATSAILNVRGASPRLSVKSASAVEIQAWVKDNAGLDVPFPDHIPASVRLTGARLAGNGVEVEYFVRNRPERLTIARSDIQGPEHRFVERSAKKISWTMGGQFFALDCAQAEDAQAACTLCHGGA